MPTNSYLPFAIAAGANVWSDATYNGSSQQQTGIQKGIVPSGLMSKAWRQSSMGSYALGQIIVDHGLIDAPDDGNPTGFKANLRMAMAAMLSGSAFGQDTSTAANAIVVALDPAPPSLTFFRQIYVRVANTNTGPATLALNNLGSKAVVRHNGTSLQAGDLPAGQLAHFLYDATTGQFVLAGLGGAEVQRIVGSPTYYVRSDGSDANDGSAPTSAKAFATIAGACAAISNQITTGTITIKIAQPGTYASPGLIQRSGGTLLITGDTNNPGNYIISGSGSANTPPTITYGFAAQFSGVTFSNTGTVANTVDCQNGTINFSYCNFTSIAGSQFSHISSSGGGVALGPGLNFQSSMGSWISANGGRIGLLTSAITFSNNPVWSLGGVYAANGGVIAIIGSPPTFSGSTSGPRFAVNSNAIINSNGGGVNYYPGSTVPSTPYPTGGQYV